MRRASSRRSAFGAIVLSLALVAGACGSKTDSGGGGGSGDDGKDLGTPTPGGSLTYGLEAESGGGWCLPTAQLAAGGIQVANSIFDPVIAVNDKREPEPYLAESYEVSDDAQTFTFKLREGITFHDGTPLNSAIVALNWNVMRGETEALTRTGLAPLLFPIVFADIDTVTTPDDLTVVVTTKRPWPAFPIFLASGRQGIVAEAQLMAGETGCAEQLIGTGPFSLESWTRNDKMVLKKNPNYWRTDADGVQLPYLDELVYTPIVDSADRFNALDGGSINAGHWNNQFTFEDLEAESDRFTLFSEEPGHREVAYGLVNHNRAPLNDQETRIKMGQAIDREALRQISNGGEWDLATGPFDSEVDGYLEDSGLPEYDPEGAKEFLEGKNLTIVLGFAEDTITEELANDVASQLAQVGVDVDIRPYDQASLINQALGGDWDVILWRNHPGADADTQYVWWHSTQPTNFGKINDAEVDRLLDEGRVEKDPAKRKTIYEDLNRRFSEIGANLWNWYSEWGVGTESNVHGIQSTLTPDGSRTGIYTGWHFMTETWIEQ